MESQSTSRQNEKNSFLAVYLIVALIVTLAENLILLRAVSQIKNRNSYLFLAHICALEICAGAVILPCTLVAVADSKYITEDDGGENFCQLLGSLSAFVYRSSTFSFCFAYVDRCLVIAKPMSYPTSQRSIFCVVSSICNTVIAATFAVLPFAFKESSSWAYKSLSNAPVCVFQAETEAGRLLLYFDSVISFGLMWMLVFLSSAGMLYIACVSSTAQSKIVPLNLGAITRSNQQGSSLPKVLPPAWCENEKRKRKSPGGYGPPTCKSKLSRRLAPIDEPSILELPLSVPERKTESAEIPPIKQGFIAKHDDGPQPKLARKSSVTATFYEELTFHRDGSTQLLTSATSSHSQGTKLEPDIQIRRNLKIQQSYNSGKYSETKLFTLSSSLHQGRPTRMNFCRRCVKRSRKTKSNTTNRSSIRHVSRVNTKALFTIASTQIVFTGMTLPVFLLLLSFASPLITLQDDSTLQLITCITMVSSYAVFPFLNVIADREMKDKVIQLMKRAFERGELESDVEELAMSVDDGRL